MDTTLNKHADLDSLRNDIITAYEIVNQTRNTVWSCDGQLPRFQLDLTEHFENPNFPTDIELNLFRLKFGRLYVGGHDIINNYWLGRYINVEECNG